MPEREYNAGGYRFGFNGMEKDDEVKGSANSLDFGARIYDSRLGRWLSVDKLASAYPDIAPFAYALNNPLKFIDADGNVVVICDDKGTPIATFSKAGVQIVPGQENNAFLKSYMEARTYIQGNNNSKVFTRVENKTKVVHVLPLNNSVFPESIKKNGAQFIPLKNGDGVVLWDPKLGLKTKTGRNSPASVLAHEFIHTNRFFENPVEQQKAVEKKFEDYNVPSGPMKGMTIPNPDRDMDNQEEQETIKETNEVMKALPLENSQRDSHRGDFYKTDGVTSTFHEFEFHPLPEKNDNIPARKEIIDEK